MIVGLLWADQNITGFGNQERLLLSRERQSLWSSLDVLSEDHEVFTNKYFKELSVHKAQLDNIKL